MKKNCSAIILAAGKSERMGSPKPFLLFDKYKNQTFIQKLFDTYHDFGCQQVVIVYNSENIEQGKKLTPNATIVENKTPELGRFLSIKLAVEQLIQNDFVFLQNADNPFTKTEILEQIWKEKDKEAYISPKFEGKGGHPILLPKTIITQIQTEMSKNLNLKQFLQPFAKQIVLCNDESILININTQEEYLKKIILKN
ncbi:MAG: NTP transferase domain-containing protein [Bacteroidales bacterium]|nr:NTP transferase domain-containing protein [Bacteroidales bacterium]